MPTIGDLELEVAVFDLALFFFEIRTISSQRFLQSYTLLKRAIIDRIELRSQERTRRRRLGSLRSLNLVVSVAIFCLVSSHVNHLALALDASSCILGVRWLLLLNVEILRLLTRFAESFVLDILRCKSLIWASLIAEVFLCDWLPIHLDVLVLISRSGAHVKGDVSELLLHVVLHKIRNTCFGLFHLDLLEGLTVDIKHLACWDLVIFTNLWHIPIHELALGLIEVPLLRVDLNHTLILRSWTTTLLESFVDLVWRRRQLRDHSPVHVRWIMLNLWWIWRLRRMTTIIST